MNREIEVDASVSTFIVESQLGTLHNDGMNYHYNEVVALVRDYAQLRTLELEKELEKEVVKALEAERERLERQLIELTKLEGAISWQVERMRVRGKCEGVQLALENLRQSINQLHLTQQKAEKL
jgi:dihydroneopterin aldolase